MVIELRLYKSLKRFIPSSSSGIVTVDIIDDITVGELLDELEIDRSMVGIILVNGQRSILDRPLYDGDKVSLLDKEENKAE